MSTNLDLEKARELQERLLRGTEKVDFNSPVDHAVLKGKTAIITGGASGIGQGVVQALLNHGARVAVLDLSCPPNDHSPDHLTENVKFIKCDVTSWEAQLVAFREVLLWSGDRLDIAILSAGVRSHNFTDLILQSGAEGAPVKPPSSAFDVNLLGAYYTAHLALWYFTHLQSPAKGVREGWRPQLLFLCSLAGYVEQPLSTDYCASKHGVRGLWKSLRAHGPRFGGCQMNLLAPTFINNRQGSTKSRGGDMMRSGVVLGEIEDVVEGALRSICDLNVDGRALCCVKGEKGSPGSNNFDLCDNIQDLNAGSNVLTAFKDGTIGKFGK